MTGPEVGSLYLCADGARVRVTGRAWAFFDKEDVIQVSIERRGTVVEEQLTTDEFSRLIANAQVSL